MDCGSPDLFWRQTPRLFWLAIRGKLKSREWAYQQALSAAWHTAAWASFTRKMPPLRKVLGVRREPPKPMSQEQMAANLRKWAIRLGQA